MDPFISYLKLALKFLSGVLHHGGEKHFEHTIHAPITQRIVHTGKSGGSGERRNKRFAIAGFYTHTDGLHHGGCHFLALPAACHA